MSRDPFFKGSLQNAFQVMGGRRTSQLGARLGDVAESVADMQEAMRIMSMGLDFPQYTRFRQLLPDIWHHDEDKDQESARQDEERGQVADREEFDFCRQFIVTAPLRIAEVDAHRQRPSWQR